MEEIGIIIYLKIKRITFWLKKKNFLIKKTEIKRISKTLSWGIEVSI